MYIFSNQTKKNYTLHRTEFSQCIYVLKVRLCAYQFYVDVDDRKTFWKFTVVFEKKTS